MVGQFKNGTMLSAKVSKVKRERCNHGIKELEIEEPNADSPTFRYTTTSHKHIGDQPTLMDPYERKMIYIHDGVNQALNTVARSKAGLSGTSSQGIKLRSTYLYEIKCEV